MAHASLLLLLLLLLPIGVHTGVVSERQAAAATRPLGVHR
jgi:hypothetical protein